MRFRLVVGVLSLLAVPASAHADGIKITQHVFTEDGQPQLVGNYSPDGSVAKPSWKICAPDCGPIVLADTSVFQPGPQAAGTTFEASATVNGVTTTDRSRAWTGQVANVTPPTISGDAKVGATVTGVAGTWSGGWGDDRDSVSLRVCTTAAATDCRRLPADATSVIDSAYAGWFIGATDERYGRESVFPAAAWPAPIPGVPSTLPARAASQTVALGALVGPIAAAPAAPAPAPIPGPTPKPQDEPKTKTLGFTPSVALRKRATTTGGKRVVGTISCKARCVAHVKLTQGKKTASLKIVVSKKKASITLPAKFSTKRSVGVAVTFDDHAAKKTGSVKPA